MESKVVSSSSAMRRWALSMVVGLIMAVAAAPARATEPSNGPIRRSLGPPPPALATASAGGADKVAACVAPADRYCGVCAIQCPVGQAAICKPGVAQETAGQCEREPVCRCGASPDGATK